MISMVQEWFDDLRMAMGFLTRVPVGPLPVPAQFARCYRVFPLVGVAIGAVVAWS